MKGYFLDRFPIDKRYYEGVQWAYWLPDPESWWPRPTLEQARAVMPPEQYADMRPFVTDE